MGFRGDVGGGEGVEVLGEEGVVIEEVELAQKEEGECLRERMRVAEEGGEGERGCCIRCLPETTGCGGGDSVKSLGEPGGEEGGEETQEKIGERGRTVNFLVGEEKRFLGEEGVWGTEVLRDFVVMVGRWEGVCWGERCREGVGDCRVGRTVGERRGERMGEVGGSGFGEVGGSGFGESSGDDVIPESGGRGGWK